MRITISLVEFVGRRSYYDTNTMFYIDNTIFINLEFFWAFGDINKHNYMHKITQILENVVRCKYFVLVVASYENGLGRIIQTLGHVEGEIM